MKLSNSQYIYILISVIIHISECARVFANNHVILFSPSVLTVAVGQNVSTMIQLVTEQDENVRVWFVYGKDRLPTTDYIKPLDSVVFPRHASHIQIGLQISGLRPGHLIVGCNTTSIINSSLIEHDFLRINIARSIKLDWMINAIGWLYCILWSCSFYLQILLNFQRQSVIGLNFDYLALNIFGYFCYSIYNTAFYSWHNAQSVYLKSHPYEIVPVFINDVVFSLHAFLASFIIIFQCLFLERANQRITRITSILLIIFTLFLSLITIITLAGHIDLLLFINFYLYVSLIISCIKYIPQALMNYQRQTTDGWSIGSVILNLFGDLLLIIQIFLFAINYNEWISAYDSITKFALGFIKIAFDVLFILQHYLFYKNNRQHRDGYEALNNNDDT